MRRPSIPQTSWCSCRMGTEPFRCTTKTEKTSTAWSRPLPPAPDRKPWRLIPRRTTYLSPQTWEGSSPFLCLADNTKRAPKRDKTASQWIRLALALRGPVRRDGSRLRLHIKKDARIGARLAAKFGKQLFFDKHFAAPRGSPGW